MGSVCTKSSTASSQTNPNAPSQIQVPSQSTLLVLGASGYMGVATLRFLAAAAVNKKQKISIKAGVRNINLSNNAQIQQLRGVDLVTADMSRPETLKSALVGVDIVFIVVPGHADRTQLAIGAIKACEESNVKHMVVLSVASAVKPDSIFGGQFISIEEAAAKSSVAFTIVRLPMFMENVLGQLQSIQSDGVFYSPLAADSEYNCASLRDLGEAVAIIMMSPGKYQGKVLTLTGPLTTEAEIAAAFSAILMREVKHVQVSYEAGKQAMMETGMMPEWQADGVVELLKMVEAKEASQTTASPDLQEILGRALTGPKELVMEVFPSSPIPPKQEKITPGASSAEPEALVPTSAAAAAEEASTIQEAATSIAESTATPAAAQSEAESTVSPTATVATTVVDATTIKTVPMVSAVVAAEDSSTIESQSIVAESTNATSVSAAAVDDDFTKSVMVLGASGFVGVATLRALSSKLTEAAAKVRILAGVRDVSSEKNAAIRELSGVELTQADMSKADTLGVDLKGAHTVFIVVPGHKERTQLALAALTACQAVGVQHVVMLSVMTALKTGSVFGDQFQPIEEQTRNCGIPFTIVRLPMFMENVLGQLQSIKSDGVFYTPLADDAKYNCVSLLDIGEAVATIMASPSEFAGKTFELTGPLTTEAEIAAAFSAILMREVKHVQVPYEAGKQAMMETGMIPEWQADGVVELLKFVEAGDETMTVASNDIQKLLDRPPRSPWELLYLVLRS